MEALTSFTIRLALFAFAEEELILWICQHENPTERHPVESENPLGICRSRSDQSCEVFSGQFVHNIFMDSSGPSVPASRFWLSKDADSPMRKPMLWRPLPASSSLGITLLFQMYLATTAPSVQFLFSKCRGEVTAISNLSFLSHVNTFSFQSVCWKLFSC